MPSLEEKIGVASQEREGWSGQKYRFGGRIKEKRKLFDLRNIGTKPIISYLNSSKVLIRRTDKDPVKTNKR